VDRRLAALSVRFIAIQWHFRLLLAAAHPSSRTLTLIVSATYRADISPDSGQSRHRDPLSRSRANRNRTRRDLETGMPKHDANLRAITGITYPGIPTPCPYASVRPSACLSVCRSLGRCFGFAGGERYTRATGTHTHVRARACVRTCTYTRIHGDGETRRGGSRGRASRRHADLHAPP